MRPVTELSNQEKAKLLHEFLPDNVKTIISCIENGAIHTLNNKKDIKRFWKKKSISVDSWFSLAEAANRKIKENRKRLITDSQFFASELFSGYNGIFSLDCIRQDIEIENNQRLFDGVKFLFDLPLKK